jgi:hypothetical protein
MSMLKPPMIGLDESLIGRDGGFELEALTRRMSRVPKSRAKSRDADPSHSKFPISGRLSPLAES